MNKKHLLLMVWVIVLLILSNLISLYFLLQPKPKPDPDPIPKGGDTLSLYYQKFDAPIFYRTMDEARGKLSVDIYRKNLLMGSHGVLYDVDTIQRYLTKNYPDLKRKMGGDTINYKYKLGFYWMITKGMDNNNRLSFCVVPTLVHKTDSTNIIDYFNDPQKMYKRPGTLSSKDIMPPPGDSGFIYNEGQLWP